MPLRILRAAPALLVWLFPAACGSDPEQLLLEEGKSDYMATCATCHLEDGRGMQSPLVNSRWVLGAEESLIRIVLHGKRGTSEMDMPPHPELSDERVAAILSYLRQAWGHDAPAVETSNVAAVRLADASRNEQWTDRELVEMEGRSPSQEAPSAGGNR